MTLRIAMLGGMLLLGVHAQAAPSSVAPSPDPKTLEEERVSRAYLDQTTQRLSLSSDPGDLILAARLTKGSAEETRFRVDPMTQRRVDVDSEVAELIALALREDAEPWVWWRAATDCAGHLGACDRDVAVATLRRIDAENGAVWMLLSTADDNDQNFDHRLGQAAVARRFDTYFATWLRRYLSALEEAIPPDAMPRADLLGNGREASPDQAQFVWAMGMAMADVLPGLNGVSRLCQPDGEVILSPQRKTRCIAALRNMMAQADLYPVYEVAAKRLATLLDGDEREAVEQERRRIAWQFAAWQDLLHGAENDPSIMDPAGVDALIAAWREPGATELGAMRKQLDAAGIALDPPAGWRGSVWTESGD